jgi:hypothetical protein
MLELYPDHCEIVKDSLQGKRVIDEQTAVSLEVLSDRLERVRKFGGKFANIAFSSAIEHLRQRPSRVAVGQG